MRRISFLVTITLLLSFAQTGARYLIITHDDYVDAIQPLAVWKREKGLRTQVVPLSQTGSDSTQIRAYIQNAYNTWDIKPEYVLLVGNDTQIRQVRYIHTLGDVYTDNYYTNISGDFRNEIIPGRFWVYDTLHVKTIVAKVIAYEKNPDMQSTSWFESGVTIVNEDEDSFPADSVYWADARHAHDLMQQAGFNHIDSLAQSFGDDSTDVIAAFNTGCSYMMYRGVGFFIWDWPFMGLWENLLNNGWQTPVVISATCATVEGIGHTWLLLGTPDQPRGTVGFFGTTTALFHAAEFRSALARGTLDGIFNDPQCTMGVAAEHGRLAYSAIFNDSLEYNSWTCLGDPDMRLWTSVPRSISVFHDTIVWADDSPDTLTVQVDAGAIRIDSVLVCIMSRQDTSKHHYAYTDVQGRVTFIDTFSLPGDSICITVTGRNLIPYQTCVPVHFSGSSHVLLWRFSINDSISGNNDGIINPGEDIEIPAWLMNWGDTTAYGVSATMSLMTPDSCCVLYDTVKYFGDIQGLDSAYTSDDGYNIMITPDCPDKYQIDLEFTIEDTSHTIWKSYDHVTVHAPLLEYLSYTFPGTYKYAPLDDTVTMVISIANQGTYEAIDVTGILKCTDSHIAIIDSLASFGTIPPAGSATNQNDPFSIHASNQLLPGTEIQVQCELRSGVYFDTISFSIFAGQRDYYIWDPDLNHSSGPVIDSILRTLRFNGTYSIDSLPQDDFLSIYKSLFVCLGIYPLNHVVIDSTWEGPAIYRYLQSLNGTIYLEGGDVWYADPHYYHGYFFYPLFEINPISTSVGPLSTLEGVTGTFTQGMYFYYAGESNSLDRIENQGMGRLLFTKSGNGFGVSVGAYNRTVGSSFELGSLVDETPPSIRNILIDSIMQYFRIPPTGIAEYTRQDRSTKVFLEISPNPALGEVRITYSAGGIVNDAMIHIFDITGRCVRSFSVPNSYCTVPTVMSWDCTDLLGRTAAQGIYFVQLTAPDHSLTRKLVLLR
jgi:hypothetical protein